MKKNNTVYIYGKRIFLRPLSFDDVSDEYLHWMSDKEVTRFLESKRIKYSKKKLKEYVTMFVGSKTDILLGIFINENRKHIGNIKIGGIHSYHRYGDIGLMIGDKNMWGKGYGTDSIALAWRYATEKLNVHKLTAGINEDNCPSFHAFLRAGFYEVGRLKKHAFFEGKYVDTILVEKIFDSFKPNKNINRK